jgi:hypothetical protein
MDLSSLLLITDTSADRCMFLLGRDIVNGRLKAAAFLFPGVSHEMRFARKRYGFKWLLSALDFKCFIYELSLYL